MTTGTANPNARCPTGTVTPPAAPPVHSDSKIALVIPTGIPVIVSLSECANPPVTRLEHAVPTAEHAAQVLPDAVTAGPPAFSLTIGCELAGRAADAVAERADSPAALDSGDLVAPRRTRPARPRRCTTPR